MSFPIVGDTIVDFGTLRKTLSVIISWDVVLIETSGVTYYTDYIRSDIFPLIMNGRELRYWPLRKSNSFESADKQIELRYNQAVERGDIDSHTCSITDFVETPALRLIGGKPNPSRSVFLFDDLTGETHLQAQIDLMYLGYTEFFYLQPTLRSQFMREREIQKGLQRLRT